MPAQPDRAFREFVENRIVRFPRSQGCAAPDHTDPQTITTFHRLAGDGSPRRIYRVRREGIAAVAVHHPLPRGRRHPDENEGFLAVHAHLVKRGVRVPAVYATDLEKGFLLLEDLGDERLYDRVRSVGWDDRESEPPLLDLYRDAIAQLVRMQAPGRQTFPFELVPNPPYTEAFVVQQESRYFHEEFVRGLAGRDLPFASIEPECRRLAGEAVGKTGDSRFALEEGEERADQVFVHRDYQSRNLMIVGDRLAVLDFQGARPGPPEYDVAALLYDPYIAMPAAIRSVLVRDYLREGSAAGVRRIPTAATPDWERRLRANAANRLMQALGAFAKLGGRFRRPGFLEHIPTGLANLEEVLILIGDCPVLWEWVRALRAADPSGPPG